ncbi:MAG: uracil-DNA glycosylase family protein [Pseudomonadota bacterium]
MTLTDQISACTLCADRFSATATAHRPKPVVWFEPGARILIASQAPGARAHASRIPFDDPSGKRLRTWMGVSDAQFYDKSRVAIVPMAFCFPGYDRNGSDLPPPPICSKTWRKSALAHAGDVPLTLLIGGYAQKWHLGVRTGVTQTVAGWRDHAPRVIPLPHPSWRNTAWIKRNPWFEAELLPVLRAAVKDALA